MNFVFMDLSWVSGLVSLPGQRSNLAFLRFLDQTMMLSVSHRTPEIGLILNVAAIPVR
jgi:hypothetical protein